MCLSEISSKENKYNIKRMDDTWWSHFFPCSRKLIDLAYTPFHAVLKCGHLTSDVQVFPRPEPFIIDEEIDPIPKAINTGSNYFFAFN